MNIVITGGSGDMGKAIISEVKTRFPEATIYEINRNIDKESIDKAVWLSNPL